MELGEGLKNAPFMDYPTANGKFTLISDASKTSTGYIPNQESEEGVENLIACGGRSLHPAERNYTITELELLSIIEALDKYRHYLLDRNFIIKSDHISLQFLNSLKDSGAGRLHRWSLRLQQYNYNLIHVRGINNNVADALSCGGYEPTINKTMDKLRQEKTVYAIQKTSSSAKLPTSKTNNIKDEIRNRDEQYVEGRNSELICQIRKSMAYFLRHGSCNERIPMDNQGYVGMSTILEWLNRDLRHNFDIEDIIWIVDNNDKVRFSIDTLRGVKANYGHSLELPEMIMKVYRKEDNGNKRYIVHETFLKYLPNILKEGLSRMECNHVHLCKQIGGSWIRRKRRANIVIHIDVQKARLDGLKFFSAPNDVIMCSGDTNGCMPMKYFKEIKNI